MAGPPTAMSYDAFKPKFPLDPFTAMSPNGREPWSIVQDRLLSLSVLQAERRAILILGQPSTSQLEPLFHSLHLASSVLIIASNRPPAIPSTTQPAVRVLHLRHPIAVENSGAPRLVAVLERAEQTARIWRKHGGEKILEFIEENENPADFEIKKSGVKMRFSLAASSISIQATAGSQTPPSASKNSLPLAPALNRNNSSSTQQLQRNRTLRRQSVQLPPTDPNQRPFDAILNFLPADLADKAILKQAILVTTLTRPYFVTASDTLPPPALRYRSESNLVRSDSKSATPNGLTRRWSLFRGSSASRVSPAINDPKTSASLNAVGRASMSKEHHHLGYRSTSSHSVLSSKRTTASVLVLRKPRIVHLLPTPPAKPSQTPNLPAALSQAQARLVRSIEAFLLSFSFPLAGVASGLQQQPADGDMERARPYILPASSLSDNLCLSLTGAEVDDAMQSDWTLAELLLSGALEPTPSPDDVLALSDIARGKQREAGVNWSAQRAWISGVSNIQVEVAKSTRRPPTSYRPKTAPSAHVSQKLNALVEQMDLPPTPDESQSDSELVTSASAQRKDKRSMRISAPVPARRDDPLHRPKHSSYQSQQQNKLTSGLNGTTTNFGLPTPPGSEEASMAELDSTPAVESVLTHETVVVVPSASTASAAFTKISGGKGTPAQTDVRGRERSRVPSSSSLMPSPPAVSPPRERRSSAVPDRSPSKQTVQQRNSNNAQSSKPKSDGQAGKRVSQQQQQQQQQRTNVQGPVAARANASTAALSTASTVNSKKSKRTSFGWKFWKIMDAPIVA